MADIMAGDIDIAQDIFFPVTIDIYFHIIDNEYVPSKSANMDNSTIDAQVRVLNKDFAHTGLFQFRLAGITRTKDPKIGKLKRGGVDEVKSEKVEIIV